MSIKPTFGFALEYVPDVEAGKRFYEEVLGLKVERYHPVFVQFEHFAIASDESMGGKGEPEIYWLVDDAQAASDELSQRTSVTPIREMPFGKVFTVTDPAGRPRFLIELAKERPSQAV